MTTPRFLKNIYVFYKDGFKNMTIGKTLWIIILVKLFIMFAVLKIFFFPDLLGKYKTKDEKANHVQMELIDKTNNQNN
ncbi:conserved hypothetical protein [uncultured Paludibacter sp.]|uniref:DUF4492 domain-containing protein n=1 Tax=uncultured Paludibacter sp. TaxID=497635 RepID=A0A653ACV9_9BACT|nr:conserved hypothetical protein [uncultured Paludibacter sp.]